MYNHVSCAACHRQGGLGGGGGVEFNVSLLCAQLEPRAGRPDAKLIAISLRNLHPAFVTDDDQIIPNILLHRFGPGERYFQLKTALGGQHVPWEPYPAEIETLQDELSRKPLPWVTRGPIRLVRAQRNTTALFGAGLIDRIPDQVFHELAASQAAGGQVSGRVPPIGPDKVGRFGWRGQQEHLHDFVLGACANELGLEVPFHSQPINPLQPKYRPTGLDLSAEECQSLTKYVASLPQPRQADLDVRRVSGSPTRGRELFETVGCLSCHVQRLGDVEEIYGDLLLHDMGPGLADPVLAEATLTFIRRLPPLPEDGRPQAKSPPLPATYYGGSTFQDLAVTGPRPTNTEIKDPRTGERTLYSVVASNLQSEWRTPPLWGVADSAPYLHDGRAETLLDAINLHAGEADFAVRQFNRLDLADRAHLLAFLRSLRAPPAENSALARR
jgi:mono/diheme cytochrome c family protein